MFFQPKLDENHAFGLPVQQSMGDSRGDEGNHGAWGSEPYNMKP